MRPKSSRTSRSSKTQMKRRSTTNLRTKSKRHSNSSQRKSKHRDTFTSEIEGIMDLDLRGARRSARELAFENPFELTPRTRYTINLLGYKHAEYCHWNDKFSYKSDDENEEESQEEKSNEMDNKRSTKPKQDPIERLKEYNFWNNMTTTLSKIQDKRSDLIEKSQTFDDIQLRKEENEANMIDELVEKNKKQTEDSHLLRSRQIERFIKDRKQQLLERIDLANEAKKEQQKHLEKEEAEKQRQEILFDQRQQERLALKKQRKRSQESRWKQLEESAMWHVEQDRKREKQKRRQIASQRRLRRSDSESKPFNAGCDEELYQKYLENTKKQFRKTQKKRAQLLTKYEKKSQQHRTLLRSKSNHFQHKNKSRRQTHKQRHELIKTQRLRRLEELENKYKNDNLRAETQKKQKRTEAEQLRKQNETQRKETYKLAKTRREQSLKTFVKNLGESEIRRKEHQKEQKRRMALKREMYNVARDNAKLELKHIRKSKQTQSAVLAFKLKANAKRDEKQKLLEKLFVQQRGKREDLQRDLDREYKTKIDNALQYQNVTEMRMLMLEYAKKNREIQEKEMHMIEKEPITELLDNQLS